MQPYDTLSIAWRAASGSKPKPWTIWRPCDLSSTLTGPRACPSKCMAATPRLNLLKSELDTPALLVDLDQMEANIARIAQTCRSHGVAWRPHAKANKTVEIVHMELAAGAIGITCAKLGEAQVMAAAGIRNILIANQIVGREKIARLMALLDLAEVIVAIDNPANLAQLSTAAQEAHKTLGVVIEVNIGMNRAGVEPGAPVVALAAMVTN